MKNGDRRAPQRMHETAAVAYAWTSAQHLPRREMLAKPHCAGLWYGCQVLVMMAGCGVANANTVNSDASCVSSIAPLTPGRETFTQTTANAADGNGTFSFVAGCNANGNGLLGVTAFGSFSAVTGQGGTAMGFDAIAAKWAVANGVDSNAGGTAAVALGFGSSASGANAVAIGAAGGDGTTPLALADSTLASQQGSIALGANNVRGAQSTAANAIAIGGESTAQATDALAVGRASSASSANAVALGAGATVSNAGAVALGSGAVTAAAVATASATIAGTSYGFAGTAPASTVSIGDVGTERTLTNLAAGRLGTTSTDAVNGSQLNATNLAVTAVDGAVDTLGAGVASSLGGGSSYDPATGTLAPPSYSIGGTAYNNVGSALGAVNTTLTSINNGGGIKYFHANSTQADSVASGSNAIAVGPLAAGAGITSVAIGLRSSATQLHAIAIGQDANATQGGTIAIGTQATASGAGSIAIGSEGTFAAVAVSSAADTLAVGNGSQATANGSVALGASAVSSGSRSTSVGPNVTAAGSSSLAAGDTASAVSDDSTALGHNAVAGAAGVSGGTAVGTSASATGANALALGRGATAAQGGAVALGAASTTAAAVATASGTIAGTTYNFAGTAPASTVSIGTAGAERTLTNLAAGRLGTTSTDAVNGSQLNATNLAVTAVDGAVDTLGTGVATSLGGGAAYDPATGTLTPPTYTVGGTTINNVGAALTNLDGRTTSNTTAITNLGDQINDGSVGLLQQDATTRNLTAGAATDGTIVDFTGTAGTRTLTGVSIGAVTATSTDAINGSQLFAGNTSIASALGGGAALNPDGTLAAPTYTVGGTTYNNVGSALGAVNTALTTINNGSGVKYFRANSVLADATATGTDSVAAGPLARAEGTSSAALGHNAAALSNDTVAIGRAATAGVPGGNSGETAVGATATATADQAAAFGFGSQASAINALAMGATASAAGLGAVAVGSGAVAGQAGAVALGAASATAAAVATASGTIAGTTYNFAGTAPASTVSIGAAGAERTLTNLAAGRVSATSTDAVNGSQLNATNLAVTAVDGTVDTLGTGVAASLGGGAAYDPATGTLTPPTYTVGGTTVNNVGAALTNLDGRTTSNTTAITNLGDQINDGSVGLLQQDATTRNLTAGAATDGTIVDFTGTAGTRTLTGVSIGAVTATSTDAINGSQLFAGNTSIATALGGGAAVNPDGNVGAPTYTINGTDYNNVGDALAHLSSGGVQSMYFHANSLLADSDAQGTDSIAVGPVASALATDAVAVGRNAVAGTASAGTGAVALGAGASATADGGLALGQGATAAQPGAVALGSGAQTDVAIGTSSVTIAGTSYSFAGAAPVSTVSIGAAGAERTLTNLAAGRVSATSTDAVNGSQLYATNQSVENLAGVVGGITTGGGIRYFRANSAGADAVASGSDSVAVGPAAAASGSGALALGQGAQASHDNSVALGAGSQTTTGAQAGYTAAYVGASTSAGEVNIGNRTLSGVAAGAAPSDAVNVSQLDGGVQNAISVANAYTETRLSQVSPGGGSTMFRVNSTDTSTPSTTGANSVAGGAGSQATGESSVAIGNATTASGASSMALGSGASATADNSVAIGVNSVAERGNAISVGAAGAERAIVHVAAGTDDTDAVNVAQLRQAQASGTQYDTTPGGTPDYTNMTLGGPGGTTTTTVHNVAAGVAPTDAVNVQQLQAGLDDNLMQSRQYTDTRLQEVEGDMRTMRDEMRGGTASAMAMAGMPQASIPGGNMLAVGMGGYEGEVGMAVGLSTMTESGRYILKANVSTNTTHDFGFAVGAGVQW